LLPQAVVGTVGPVEYETTIGDGRSTALRRLKRQVSPVWHRIRVARLVRERARFAGAAAAEVSGARRYHLADGDESVLIRQDNVEDRFILGEVFDAHEYAVPPSVARALGEGVLKVVDLGGNIGLATLWFAREFPDAQFTAIEADPANADVLERVVALNRVGTRIRVLRVAGGVRSGSLELVSGLGGRSHAAANIQDEAYAARIIEVPMIDVLPIITEADFLKMDIEGGEWEILSDPRFATTGLRAICMEFHRYGCPTDDPTSSVTELLGAAGFSVAELREDGDAGIAWAIRNPDPD
jgi:FkbM family methyltransferase